MASPSSKAALIAPIPVHQRVIADAAQATPAEMFRLARKTFLAGEKLDMNQLAARLGIGRATLYRWTGDRDRLLVDVIWSITKDALDVAAERAAGSGASRLAAIFGEQIEIIAGAAPLRAFLEHEGQAGLRLVTQPGGVHGRLVQSNIAVIQQEIAAGHYRPPADLETLVEAMVSVGEHFLYTNLLGGFRPQPDKARQAIRLLLREEPAAPAKASKQATKAAPRRGR